MTKAELIEKIAQKTNLTKKATEDVLGSLTETIRMALAKGQKVTITGFGTFDVSRRSARAGRNPQTGAKIQIPAMTVPRFRAGKKLKAAVK